MSPSSQMQMQFENSIENGKCEDDNNKVSDVKGIISFLHLVQDLKINKRRGWLKMGIPFDKTESIADHMYRMSLMVQLIADPRINKPKCIKMALVHDMAESITTDIIPDDNIPSEEKNRLETEAMNKIKLILGSNPFGQEAEDLWKEYSSDSTIDANFVKDLDKLELIIQAIEYEKEHLINFDSWIEASKTKIRHFELKEWLQQVLKERQ